MTDVFISYARPDRNRVRIIALGLAAEGFSVWWDPEIKPGSKWNDAIRKSLDGAAAVVTCWSPASIKSNWVVAETTHASNAKKLAPCLVKACQPPIPFNMIQSPDLSNWNGDADDADWVLFLRHIRGLIEAKRRAAAAIPPPGEAEGATGQGTNSTPSAASTAAAPPPQYVRSTTRGRLGPRIAPTILGAVVITALLTGGWWAIERGPLNSTPSAPSADVDIVDEPPPLPTDPLRPPAPAPPPPPPPQPEPIQRVFNLENYSGYDLDTGELRSNDSTADFHFVPATSHGPVLAPAAYAGVAFAPTVAMPAPERAACEAASYSSEPAQLHGAGTAYCVRTDQGRLAYIEIQGPGTPDWITVRALVWEQ